MVVQHNLTAMNSNRMLGLTTKTQSKSTEKLSSGYKINRAADDAAGLSISEKMRRQIRGLTQASLNAQDGISAVQTAEGALTEVHDMLQRMDELATKAANGTMSADDRQAVQDEIDQLVTEIDRVSETTKFNELELLKGDGEETKTKTINGTPMTAKYAKDNTTVTISKIQSATTPEWYLEGDDSKLADDDAIIANLVVGEDGKVTTAEGKALYKTAAVTTEYGAQTKANQVTDADIQAIYGASAFSLYSDAGVTKVAEEDLKLYFNEDGTYKGGLQAKTTAGGWAEVGAEQIDDFVTVTPAGDPTEENYQVTKDLTFKLHVGSESDEANKITVAIKSMSAKGIGVDTLSGNGVMTADDATAAIDTIKDAISIVSKQRSALGAVQNRLEHTINNLDNVVENTTAAESQIRDTDMATEMVKYSNNNILAQAGQAMLAQSNQANQGVLSLLS
ncbi:MAG: hypothetical protein J6C64_08030 [Lachnospiraceae bacterium]|nr:hypothetical protein [Lachnospiraceae bacterium]